MQSDGTYHLKILVPSVAAGAIIGKGGETIAQLQKDTNARVKMSKANDFYPGECFMFLFLCVKSLALLLLKVLLVSVTTMLNLVVLFCLSEARLFLFAMKDILYILERKNTKLLLLCVFVFTQVYTPIVNLSLQVSS